MTTKNLLSSNDSSLGWPVGREEFLERDAGVRLFTRSTNPLGASRATIILTHGLGEHSSRYGHVAAALGARGWKVVAWDLRGHGRSSGLRGDVAEYRYFMEDLAAVCARYREEGKPLFLYAHSLGGQIVLRFLQTQEIDCRGVIIASPWLRLAFDPPWWKLVLARLAMRFWPGFIQSTGNRWERLTRDHSHLASLPEFDLVHHRISARLYFAVRAMGEQILTDARSLRTPLLILHGDADPVTSHHATCEFFEQAGSTDKTLRIFPGSRHETHNDLDRTQVISQVVDWIEARVTSSQ